MFVRLPFRSSILMDMSGMSADSARTVVSKMSEYSSHKALNFRCRLGGPFILIKSIIDEPVVADCGLYSNGSSVNSISSLSSTDSMMSLRCLIVAKVADW